MQSSFQRFSGSSRPNISPGAIIAAILGVAIVSVIVILVLRGGNDDFNEMATVQEEIESTCTDDSCAFRIVQERAQAARTVSTCSLLEDSDAVEPCVLTYAYDLLDPAACDALRGESRVRCSDDVHRMLALQNQDITFCDRITDEGRKAACGDLLIFGYVERDDCSLAGSFSEECSGYLQEVRSFANQITSVDYCDQIQEPDEEEGDDSNFDIALCSLALNTDFDGDSLYLEQELELGTDPQNSDTDGDGFDDGTEVKNGFNPLGE